VTIFELLQQAAYPDLKEFVKIAGGDGQKFHAFEQRIAEIPGFFEHAPIKFQPRCFAVQEWGAIAQSLPNHVYRIMSSMWNTGFVSGYRFSDTVSLLKTDAPLGAAAREVFLVQRVG
jgi:hypothetical protein